MSKPFFDSNVILYLLSGDVAKADRTQSLLAAGAVMSVQVLNEVTTVCQRKLKMPWAEIDALRDLMTPPSPPKRPIGFVTLQENVKPSSAPDSSLRAKRSNP